MTILVITVLAWVVFAVTGIWGQFADAENIENWLQGASLFVAIPATLYCLLWVPFIRHEALLEEQAPKFRISSQKDGCKWHHPERIPPLVNLRIAVECDGIGEIMGCKAVLVKIEQGPALYRGGGMNFPLTFARSSDPDAMNKTLRNGVLEYVDVIAVRQDGTVETQKEWPSYFGTLTEAFCSEDVVLTISITGEKTKTVTKRVALKIDPNYTESSLEILD